MTSRTVRCESDLDPVQIGARSGLLWSSGDFALAGIGEHSRIAVSRPDGAAAAQAALAALSGTDEVKQPGTDEVKQPGTGVVGFGAFPFDRELTGELIVPEIIVGRDGEGLCWVTTVGDVDDPQSQINDVLARRVPAGPEATELSLSSVLPPEVWRDEVLGYAIDRIRSGALKKAVLARELVLRSNRPIDAAVVLERLWHAHRSAIVFAVDRFVGASPELLVARSGETVRAHPLAGTAPRASDPTTDAALAADLLGSTKDQWEHAVTINWLLETLLPFCSYVDAEPEPTIVSLPNVHHLGTRVEGLLATPAASVLELVAALHPTPAVGGDPQSTALELIDSIERADRGRYAGPAGWVDDRGNGAFAVSVRSAQLGTAGPGPSETRLFAGVGVVADSDPDSELAETRSKFQAMLGALLRP